MIVFMVLMLLWTERDFIASRKTTAGFVFFKAKNE